MEFEKGLSNGKCIIDLNVNFGFCYDMIFLLSSFSVCSLA